MNQTQPGSFQSIALDAIRPSRTNPRKNFDPAALEELTQSIQEMGVTVPILVRPNKPYFVAESISAGTWDAVTRPTTSARLITHQSFGRGSNEENAAAAQKYCDEKNSAAHGFEIVAGERRYVAAQAAGLQEIPAYVRDLSDAEAMDLQLVENLQREDLHPVEEAEGYRALMAIGASAEDVAKKAGKTTAHVQKTLKLLGLELPAKKLFHARHLTLEHALLLARLTPADQDRAVRDLLGANHLPKKEDMVAYVDRQINWQEGRTHRLVRSTAGELRYWIETQILLSLAKVPWSLGDPDLVPEAGPCTTCPKRTGSNIALFADMTVKEDVCLDAACFVSKQKAAQAAKLKAAADAGKPLLKLSTKSGNAKIEGEVSPKTTLKHGQWIKAAPGSCDSIRKGLLTEEPGRYTYDGLEKNKAGDVVNVCADQDCKVHKHNVDAPKPKPEAGKIGSVAASAEDRRKAEEQKRTSIEKREVTIRQEIYDAMLPKVTPVGMYQLSVGHLFGESVSFEAAKFAADKLGLKVTSKGRWDDAHETAIKKHVVGLDVGKLAMVAFYLLAGDGLTIEDYHEPDEEESRERLWALAESLGVDADAIAEKVEAREAEAAKAAAAAEKAKAASGTKVAQSKAASSTPAKKAGKTTTSDRTKTGTPIDGKSAGAGARAEAV